MRAHNATTTRQRGTKGRRRATAAIAAVVALGASPVSLMLATGPRPRRLPAGP